jgi:hypothetical protein
MKGTNHGILYSRCDLCGEPAEDNYCKKCLDDTYKRCSEELDKLIMEIDNDIVKRQMAKVLSDRGYW